MIFGLLSLANLTKNEVLSIYLRMIRFHSSSWLSKIPLFTNTAFS
jgi:hypothetical protein